jgi:hypothetical protein
LIVFQNGHISGALAELIRSTRAPTKDRLIGEIMGGYPVFRGTRVPVHMLAELVAARVRARTRRRTGSVGVELQTATDDRAVQCRDNRHAAILDPVESAVPSLGKKYSVPITCIGEGTEVGASGKMLSLAKQDNDAHHFGQIAKECLETSDRRFVKGISLGRARQAQQRYRAALAHRQSTRQDPP